jgi:hypothetical protein
MAEEAETLERNGRMGKVTPHMQQILTEELAALISSILKEQFLSFHLFCLNLD